jgi:hypothetical protein
MRTLIKVFLSLLIIVISFVVGILIQTVTTSLILPGLGFFIILIFGLRGIWTYKSKDDEKSDIHKLKKDV